MDQEKLIQSLKLQVRIYQCVIGLFVLIALIWGSISLFSARPYAILADGKPVVYLATVSEANSVLDQVKRTVTGVKPSDVTFAQNIDIGRGSRNAPVLSEKDAVNVLRGKISLRLRKAAIVVSGVPVVAVDSKETAEVVLESARQKYGSLAKNLMEEPSIKEEYTVQVRNVEPELYQQTVEGALDALLSGSGSSGSGTYSVASGDVAGAIADKFNMTLSQLKSLNSGRNIEKLQIGDLLKVAKSGGPARPHLTVVVRDKEERTEVIPFTTQTVSSMQMNSGKQLELSPGRNGLRHIVVAQAYENGTKAGSEVVEENIIRNPVPRRVAIGIRNH